ncbi:SDR family oxidoreductase [Thermasporomyces composti]|jgi:NAD(P)-dependent dehydrogenase (short-subunit alcohol dehydrogenase family)|uniref:NAD(P)-dependent dehydrogenase (Short-subunit alcohol dehydrogenase family) n=1 Tax=Thermasporomyces composti TaxID=696763 RepID=A0A3D9V5R2_THECX|nr:SDR family oxidoreductase [Thermasporomyces composti]REF36706.1 NAD(P)-dependent dehydrogenase (short-subunit alcohol dehydrogenase family) [Thermasporomyces composti]
MSSHRGVAVVTGGSRGIGAATALLLAQRGWDVCIGYHSAQDAAEAVARACEERGAKTAVVRCDVAVPDDIAALFAAADALGTVTALVNNAGIVYKSGTRLDEITPERLERMLAVNVVGAFLCAREAVRRMSSRYGGSGGAIVNVSSTAARLGGPGEYVDYAASKGAVDSMTVGLAREVAEEGIRVNAVRPGLIETEIHASGGDPDRVRRNAGRVPMKRGGRPEEVANAIVWLCSPEASYVTGALLDVSGGR